MEAMRFLGFVAIVLAGGVIMAIVWQFLNTERGAELEARKRGMEVESGVQSVATLPAFFATLQTREHPLGNPKFDDTVIAFLESHVKAEQAMVRKFVQLPSVDSLYRRTQSPRTMH